MTVSSTISRADYNGNGLTRVFGVPFYFLEDAHVKVFATTLTTGVVRTLTLGSDYNLTGAGNEAGGSATLSPFAPDASQRISIVRDVPLTQETDYVENDPFPAAAHEDALDKLTMIVIQQNEGFSRALSVPLPEQALASLPAAALRAGRILAFDSYGNPTVFDPSSIPGSDGALVAALAAAFGSSDPTKGASLVTFQSAANGSIARPVAQKLSDTYSLADFGAKGDGTTDDTTAIQAAFNYGIASTRPIRAIGLNGNTFKTTAPLNVTSGLTLLGDGHYCSKFVASGNFDAIIYFGATAGGCKLRSIAFDTTGTTTACVVGAVGSQALDFDDCSFNGNAANKALAFFQSSGAVNVSGCGFGAGSSTTVGLQFDSYCDNCYVHATTFSGAGSGLYITNNLARAGTGPQGCRIENCLALTTGRGLSIGGQAYLTIVNGNVLDIGGVILSGGATLTMFSSNWVGGPAASAALFLNADTGSGTTIQGNTLNSGGTSACLQIGASASFRVSDVTITDNILSGAANQFGLVLDSVNNCVIERNRDNSVSTGGSYAIVKTNAAGGNYDFGNNRWSPTALIGLNLSGASIHARQDRGQTFANKGYAPSTAGVGALTVMHGLIVAPTAVQVTPNGDAGSFHIQNITSSSFVIAFSNAATAIGWHWSAEVFS